MTRDIATYLLQEIVAARKSQIAHYRDMLLRWLQMKRDYPWNNEPEPDADIVILVLYRDDIIREFNRTI